MVASEGERTEPRVKRPFNHNGKEYHYTFPSGEVMVIAPGKRGGLASVPAGTRVRVVKLKVNQTPDSVS